MVVYFLPFFSRILLSKDTGVGPNHKIFEKYFLELSYNLLFKNMQHTSNTFLFCIFVIAHFVAKSGISGI